MLLRSKIFILFFFLPFLAQAQQALHEGLYADKTIVNNKSLWGFKNKKGKWEIKPQFDSVYHPFEYGKAIVGKDKKQGVIDSKNNVIIPLSYQEILPQVKHLFPVRSEKGMWGFVTNEGKTWFPCQFDNFRLNTKDKYILLQKDLRWAIYSMQGKALTAHAYKQIEYTGNKNFRLLPFASWQIIQANGTSISTAEVDTLRMLTKTTVCYTIQGRKGIRSLSKELCPAQFDNIQHAHDSLYFVKKNGYWGVATANGTYLAEPKFEEVKAYPNYFIATLKYRERKIYNWNLKPLTHESYLNIADSSDGMWAVQNNIDLWGYLNAKGELKIPCRYSKAEPFKNGLAKVTLEGVSYYINVYEEQIITPSECSYYESGFLKVNRTTFRKSWIKGMHEYDELKILSDNYYRIKSKTGYGILNDKGNLILPCEYNSIELSTDEKLLIAQKKKVYYLYTSSGQLVGVPHKRFERVIDASEGLIKVRYKGGLGFCDYEDKIVISTQYDATGLFKNGFCAVKLRGKWGYIDRDERLVLQPYYDEPAIFYGEAGILKEKNEYHLINTKAKLTIEYPMLSIERTADGYYIIQNKAGLYGLANAYGKEIFPPKYKAIKAYEGNIFIVTDDEYSGAIDGMGKIIIPIKYHILLYDPLLKLFMGGVKKDFSPLTLK